MVDSACVPPPVLTHWKLVAVSGWGRLKAFNARFTLMQLDDPQTRAKYHVGLIHAIVHAPLYAGWRVAGWLFKRADWSACGMERSYYEDVPLAATPVSRRTIELEPLGVQWQEFREVRRFYLVCGYDPTTDTFFVQKR